MLEAHVHNWETRAGAVLDEVEESDLNALHRLRLVDNANLKPDCGVGLVVGAYLHPIHVAGEVKAANLSTFD